MKKMDAKYTVVVTETGTEVGCFRFIQDARLFAQVVSTRENYYDVFIRYNHAEKDKAIIWIYTNGKEVR